MRLDAVEEGMKLIARDVGEIKVAILGDMHGFVGLRQKSDEAYESMLIIRDEHKEMRRDVEAIKSTNFKRQGMMVGFGVVAGTFLNAVGKKVIALLGGTPPGHP